MRASPGSTSLYNWGFPDRTSDHVQIIISRSPFQVFLAGLRTACHRNEWLRWSLTRLRTKLDSLCHAEEVFLFLYTKHACYLMVLGFCYSFLAIPLERLYYFCIQLVHVINFINRFHNNG